MSEFRQSAYWNRLAIEGAVIVVSILLAFAIDAWWGELQQRDAEIRQLARVSAELNTNAERNQGKLETLSVAVNATSEFLSWMGPDPENVESQVFSDGWSRLYSIGTFSLMRGASENFLAVGRIGTERNALVRGAVAEWYSQGDDLERQYDLLREAHAKVGEYLLDSMPTLHLHRANAAMADHPTSKFPFDRAELLSDPRLESRFSLYLIRLEFVTRMAQELLERQSKLLVLIESAVEQ